MNLDEMFRHFFGFRDYPDAHRGFFEDSWSENPEDDFRNQGPRNFEQEEPGADFHFRTFASPPFGIMKHFEELFRNFGLADFPPVGPHFNQLQPPNKENDSSPRERMLKDQEISPHFHKPWYEGILEKPGLSRKPGTDSDLDVEVSEGGLSNLIPTPRIEQNPHKFFSSSISIRTIQGADGKLEEHRTVRDSTGKEETTVRRVIGNESHAVTTLRDADGLKEKREAFINMNEGSLKDFNNKWAKQELLAPQIDNLPATGDSSYGNIFKKIFGFFP